MAKLKKRKTSESEREVVQELDVEPITCKLLGIREWSYSSNEGDLLRFGRYHSSTFPEVEMWGSKRWVVGTYIMVDYESLREKGKTDDEIVQGCIKFLNQPPPRRKFQRKVRKPTYGNLNQVPISYSFAERSNEKVITVLVITDSRRNKKFWGEGIKL